MKLIVGLGNTGAEFQWTPHNMGFLAIDRLAERWGIRATRPEAKSQVGIGEFQGQQVVLAKPQTMMNLSGVAVEQLFARNECSAADLIVLVDDIDIPWGTLRIRGKGSAGTHNGLKSVISAIGTSDFARVRLGIGPDQAAGDFKGDLKYYVLAKMGKAQRESALQMAAEATEAVEMILTDGVEKAMTRFNRRTLPAE